MKMADKKQMSLKEMIAVLAVTAAIMITAALVFKNMSEARDTETALVR